MTDATPSPVKRVMQFENDEVLARKLQTLYNDEAEAHHLEQAFKVEDEFDRVTREVDDQRSEKLVRKLTPAVS